MITIKTPEELDHLRKGGKILHEILHQIIEKAQVGITTAELNTYAEELIKKKGVKPSFKGYNGFPAAICTSVNDEVVHGIPCDYALQDGDIVGIDLGIWYNGLCTDSAYTVAIGKVDDNVMFFLKTVQKALKKAINVVKPGNRVGDISNAIQKVIEKQGYSPVRDCVGHGVGYKVHEAPDIPNFGSKGKGPLLKAGMVIAIEPIVNMGSHENYVKADNWTIASADQSLSGHYEHTVIVTPNGAEIVT